MLPYSIKEIIEKTSEEMDEERCPKE